MSSTGETTDARPLAIAYARVSTKKQTTDECVSLNQQRETLIAAGEARGYRVEVVIEPRSAKRNGNRPLFDAALARLDEGEASALIVTRLDRLSRDTRTILDIRERAERFGWKLWLLDLDIDLSTGSGEMVLTTVASAGRYEHRMISARVTESYRAREAKGIIWGVNSGPRPILSTDVRERIYAERQSGKTLAGIAADLTADGIETARGGKWYPTTVDKICKSFAREKSLAA